MIGQEFIDTLRPLLAGAQIDPAVPTEQMEETATALNKVLHIFQTNEFDNGEPMRERVQTLLDMHLAELNHRRGSDGMSPLIP